VNAHGPERDFQLDNLPSRHLFLFVVRVERDQFGAPFRILCPMRRAENAGWASVLSQTR
jgi:hypothetical protein